jgi:uncharacterized membrane protein YheB (UPF0754 family)
MEQLNFKGVKQVEKYVIEKQKLENKEISRSFSKEMIKEAIESIIEQELNKLSKENFDSKGDVAASSVLSTAYTPSWLTDKGKKQAESILSELVDIALTKGISQSVRASLKTKNAYLIDKLHDLLIDKFYEVLSQIK